MATVLLPLILSFAGCTSSREVSSEQANQLENGTYILSGVTRSGNTVDFSTSRPGFAVLADSAILCERQDSIAQKFTVSEFKSLRVSEVSWLKTGALMLAVPVIVVALLFLSTSWKVGG